MRTIMTTFKNDGEKEVRRSGIRLHICYGGVLLFALFSRVRSGKKGRETEGQDGLSTQYPPMSGSTFALSPVPLIYESRWLLTLDRYLQDDKRYSALTTSTTSRERE